MKTIFLASAALAVSMEFAVVPAQAGTILGGSTLLDASGLAQLQTWLGKGDLTLTNIFTKNGGNTSTDFHTAADGQGPTITLMSATDDGVTATIGGYDPESWNSSGSYNTPSVFDAFVFNFSSNVLKRQINQYQTFDNSGYGPTFGGGHDIYVDSALSNGYSYGFSYGSASGISLVSDQSYNGPNMQIGALEVFTINATPVPEPATVGLLTVTLVGFVAARRRRVIVA